MKYYKAGGITNPYLVRYYAENVWKLHKPQVLISITSGHTTDYNLESSIEDHLLYDMMEMTNNLNAWLITNGACHGFAKQVGLYRSKYAVTTPLIGICTAPHLPESAPSAMGGGLISRHSLSRNVSSKKSCAGDDLRQEWMEHVDTQLDSNHSHFILATNTRKGDLQHTKLRSDFEACVEALVAQGYAAEGKVAGDCLLCPVPCLHRNEPPQ